MKTLYRITLLLCVSTLSLNSFATNLQQVYRDALKNDPSYRQAESVFLAKQTDIPQQLAALLPQLTLNGSAAYSKTVGNSVATSTGVSSNANNRYKDHAASLTLTQTLFDFSKLASLNVAEANAHAATAVYAAATEALLQRTASAYFNILQNNDILRFAKAREKALKRQYHQAKQRYKVGLDTVTDVYQAQAGFEAAAANTIAMRNKVMDAKETLHEITSKYYPKLASLKSHFKLLTPKPTKVDTWVKKARSHNFNNIANRYWVQAAAQTIKQQFGGHLPTLNFTGSYTNTYTRYMGVTRGQRNKTTAGEIDLALPLFAGGGTHAQVKQARFNYQGALAKQDKDRRATSAQTRRDYHGIIAILKQIHADKRAVQANISALKGAEAEFKVGTKTMLDVLTQQENLFKTQSTLAQDRYTYINDMIKLEQDAGQLNITDFKKINHWLASTTS